MIDNTLVQRKFERSTSTYDKHAHAQRLIALQLIDRLTSCYPLQPRLVLEIGCGTGLLTRQLVAHYHPNHYYLNDLNGQLATLLPSLLQGIHYTFLQGDAQAILLPCGMDLIVSSSAFQWFSDMASLLEKMEGALTTGGYLAFSTFGKANLREIRAIESKGLDYYTLSELNDLIQLHFDVLYASEAEIQLYFDSPMAVLRHLSATGVNGVEGRVWSKTRLHHFCKAYNELFTDTAGVTLTYHPIYFIVKKR